MQNLKMKMRQRGDAKPPWWYRSLLLILALMVPSQATAQGIDPYDQVPPPQLVAGLHLKLLDRDGEPEKRRLKIKLRDDAITTPAPGDAGDPTLDGAWLIVKNPTTGEQDSVPVLAAEADVTPGVRLGWAGRTVADVNIVLETGEMVVANNPLEANGSLLYQLDAGIDPASVLALPGLAALIASSGEHVAVFFDLLSAGT